MKADSFFPTSKKMYVVIGLLFVVFASAFFLKNLENLSTKRKIHVPRHSNFHTLFKSKLSPASIREGMENGCGKKEKLSEEKEEIDIFSQLSGNIDCINKSSGLTNSMGGLCLNEETVNLLRTRGGNAESGEAVIGAI